MKVTGITKETLLTEYLRTNLSIYSSRKNGEEIISEVFSDYFNGNQTEFSLSFIEMLDKIISERGATI